MGQRPGSAGYTGNRKPQTPGGGGGAQPNQYLNDARKIIDDADAEVLVRLAERVAKEGRATRTSVRRLYGEARRIDFLLDQDEERALRRARLLEPRLQYQLRRDPNLNVLVSALLALLHRVTDPDASDRRERYRRFGDFFEAIVAYLPEK